MEALTDLSCDAFSRALAAKRPVPGGGGAAALTGALAAALCSMVGNFTCGKARYADVEDDVARMLAAAEDARVDLLDLVQADAAAFEPLARAYKMPKDDPTRPEVMEAATRQACTAPVRMVRRLCQVIELLEEMGQKGSRMLLSDVGCGSYLAEGALQSAALSVYVNTWGYRGRAWADELDAEVAGLVGEYLPRCRAVEARVANRFRA